MLFNSAEHLQYLHAHGNRFPSAFQILPLAASDVAGQTVYFKAAADFGTENLGLATNHSGQMVPVQTTSVDALIASYGFDRIDVLSIDTEGHDPAVLRGARKAFHMHPLHYWPGTQKFLKPRTGRAPLS
eukprot:COSAG01_NODE_1848_length_9066_cov_6.023754_11_plen_129_part_00